MTTRPLRRIALALFLAVILPVPAMAATKVVEGEVTYRERIALPLGAMIEVTLVDASRPGGSPVTVARATFRARAQAPFRYRLSFDDRRIDPRHAYALRARILVNGKLWFASPAGNPLQPGGGRVEILVRRAAGLPEDGRAGPRGRWLAEDIGGAGVIDRLQSVLVIEADGKVAGSGGCNRIMGHAEIAGPAIKFGPIATTYMLCVPAAMDQEGKFIAALGAARAWRIDAARAKLILLDAEGKPVLVLARQ